MSDGIINLYKPAGLTSAQTLYRVRQITGVRKSGHAGTLDAPAEGVLLICLGRATRLVEMLMGLPKVYRALARLDLISDTLDSAGTVQQVQPSRRPAPEEVLAACAAFEGRIEQVPPAISALKIGGKPAWRLARRGSPPALAPRIVHIYWIHVQRYCWPELEFELACGRGTYVRALVRDLGLRLGTGGCLVRLVRTAVGPFTADQAWTLERLAAPDGWKSAVVAVEDVRQLVTACAIPSRPERGRAVDSRAGSS